MITLYPVATWQLAGVWVGVIKRSVKGTLYAFYRYRDRTETSLGRVGSPEVAERLREVRRNELQGQLVVLANELIDLEREIQEAPIESEPEEDESADEPFSFEKKEDWRIPDTKSYYTTPYGAAYHGDSLELMGKMDKGSVDLIVTSVPFALVKKKDYGNEDAAEYVKWFKPFAEQFHRILSDEGNLVIHIGGAWNKGEPTKSLYTYKLLIALVEEYEQKFKLCQDFYWYNPAKLPSPAEWVTVKRVRVKDSVEFVWWLSKVSNPKADNRRVLKLYSESMKNLLRNGYTAKKRPSGHDISGKFKKNHGGAIPPNLLKPDTLLTDLLAFSNTESNSRYQSKCREFGLPVHPARFLRQIPEFFIRFLTDSDSKILDPFGGSNVTGEVAESMGRRWMAIELIEDYLKGSMFRFKEEQLLTGKGHITGLKPVIREQAPERRAA